MPRKLTLKLLILPSLILWLTGYTQAPGDSTYTLSLWQARLLVRDAFIKHIQDTLIDSLESKIGFLERNSLARESQFRELLHVEHKSFTKQAELTQVEASLKNHYKAEVKRYTRQRNVAYAIAAGLTAIIIFKPP